MATAGPIAVSAGDPSGIGPDIILKSWDRANQEFTLPPLFVVGSLKQLSQRAEHLGLDIRLARYEAAAAMPSGALPVLDTGIEAKGVAGCPDATDAKATLAAIDIAVKAIFENKAAALVTAPINKHVLYEAGFSHPGHTEYLGELARRHTGVSATPVMMIAGPQLRTVPVTVHIPLQDVAGSLTSELIVETGSITAHDLKDRFGISNPRLAIAGLNPHAGENGSIGQEDNEIIRPAVETLKQRGIEARGPLPADTMFHAQARKNYDAAICMYHDQALIPAKMIGFDDGVNVTLGLPFIRTSPDHGTAYDIAGTGKANPSSFIAALRMAAEMVSAK